MSSIRLDKVIMSSLHEAFRNRERLTGSVTLSGSIPGGSHKTFSTNIQTTRASAIYEIYYQLSGGSIRRRANNSSVCLDVSWSHNIYVWISNPSANILRLTLDVDNPGATASIATQTVNFIVYVFDTPF